MAHHVVEWCAHPAFGDANTIEERRRKVYALSPEAAAEEYALQRFDVTELSTHTLYLQVDDRFFEVVAHVRPRFELKEKR